MSRGCGYSTGRCRRSPFGSCRVVLAQPSLEEGPGVDAGRRVALHVDVVAGQSVILAPPEVVEADVVERCGRRERRQGGRRCRRHLVGPHDHRRSIPADERSDTSFDVFVAGEEGLLSVGIVLTYGVHTVGGVPICSSWLRARSFEIRKRARCLPDRRRRPPASRATPVFRRVDVVELLGEGVGHTSVSLAAKFGKHKLLSYLSPGVGSGS